MRIVAAGLVLRGAGLACLGRSSLPQGWCHDRRRVAEAVAYRLGQKAGQTWDDLRSTVSHEGWRRGGHMRRLPVDLLIPGLLEAGAFLSATAAARYEQFTPWFIEASENIELTFAPAARPHAHMWTPSQLFLIILFFILLAAIVTAWFCIGGGKIVRGFKRHEFAVGQVVGTAVSVFLIGPVIVVPLRFLYLGEISQSELELIQSSSFLLAVGLFFAFLALGDLHERRESYR